MRREDVSFNCYYDINLDSQDVRFTDADTHDILNDYIIKTVDFVMNESQKCQLYKLKRETNEVYSIVKSILTNDENDFRISKCEDIANILLESELSVIRGAIRPAEGALLQAIINKENNISYYVLIKNEFFSGINRHSIEQVEAFLYDEKKKSPLKICIYEIEFDLDQTEDSEFKLLNVYVDDSIQVNHGPTWYDDFLGLEKCNTDEVNTNNAIGRIIAFWENNIDDSNQSLLLRNDTISYFRSNERFDLDDYINNINDRHQFEEDGEQIFNEIRELSTSNRKGFDQRFLISQDNIKKRIITKKFHPLKSQKIVLSIEGEIDFNDINVVEEEGDHFLRIRTNDEHTINSLKYKELNVVN